MHTLRASRAMSDNGCHAVARRRDTHAEEDTHNTTRNAAMQLTQRDQPGAVDFDDHEYASSHGGGGGPYASLSPASSSSLLARSIFSQSPSALVGFGLSSVDQLRTHIIGVQRGASLTLDGARAGACSSAVRASMRLSLASLLLHHIHHIES
jgi:hypothetical protein